jgi:pyruvate/2-oxoglutarate dehydrogenase complex dihydrolipoamide acyltransferase (E2) component
MPVLQEITVPLLAVNDTTLTVVETPVASGARVKKGEQVMVFETSKTTYEVEAEADGFLQLLCEVGADYAVNTVVAKIFDSIEEFGLVPESLNHPQKIVTIEHAPAAISIWQGETIFSASAMQLITEKKYSVEDFKGRDFVSLYDVQELKGLVTKEILQPKQKKSTSKPAVANGNADVIRQRLSANKRREIEYLSAVQETGLTSTINTYIETEGLFERVDNSLSFLKGSLLPLIIYEASRLLKKYPLLNGYFDGDAVALYNRVDVGFAIDIDKGLKVLKIAEEKTATLRQVEEEIMLMSERYLDDKIKIEDLTNISFTITDLSAEAVAFFRPLINMLNSAILGVSSIDAKLNRCVLSLTFDHRVTEGKAVAQFLAELKARLESYRMPAANRAASITCSNCRKTLKEDLSEVGFVKSIGKDGKEGYLCQSCLKGF